MNHQRGRIFVDPPFQGRLLARLAAYWVIYHFILWHLMFLFGLFTNLINQGSGESSKSLLEQYREFTLSHMSIIVCFFVTLPLIARDMIRFSHRMVGPLIRFREVIKQMVRGESVSEVKLRPRDLPTDFLTLFNQLVVAWNARQGEAKRPTEELEMAETV